MNRKTLLVFDLNCLLGYFQHSKNKLIDAIPDMAKPIYTIDSFNIYHRPNLDILLKSIFVQKKPVFDVAVWSCQTKENTNTQLRYFLGNFRYNLKFALFSKPVSDDLLPHTVNRDLNTIFKDHKDYDMNNTIIISNFPNENSDFRPNDLLLPLYHPTKGLTDFCYDGHMYFLYEYLVLLDSLKHKTKNGSIRDLMLQLKYDKVTQLRTGNKNPNRFKWDNLNENNSF